MSVAFVLDGRTVEVAREDVSLLEALREDLGVRSAKDGCSPQGQCGCCTVLVDGAPRVACVTPLRRVADRTVTTADGLDPEVKDRLVWAFLSHGASQCGFCTPGILCRLAPLGPAPAEEKVEQALLAHLCRCTGWRTIVEAARDVEPRSAAASDPVAAAARATLEGRSQQEVGPDVVLGRGGFADDTAPDGCLVAVPDGSGGWSVGETLAEARSAASKVQGRRSGHDLVWPLDVPAGEWDFTLQTTWVEPSYLEPDSSWCAPGGEPALPLGNGGAFGGKVASAAPAAARELSGRWGRAVRVVFAREDVVRMGPKRPPAAGGMCADGRGVLRLAGASPEVEAAVRAVAPGVSVEVVEVGGPPVSASMRGAGWAEAAVLAAGARAVAAGEVPAVGSGGKGVAVVAGPAGGRAEAEVSVDDSGHLLSVRVGVECGPPLDEVVLRSYVTGAAHQALGWVCSEAIALDEEGVPVDLTIRSFGVLRARETPPISVSIDAGGGEPVNGSDAAFAAVAGACWIALGMPPRWPAWRAMRR